MTTIFLDWDVSYRYWSSHTRDRSKGKRSVGWMRNRLRLYETEWRGWKWVVSYRRSGSGRIHVRLEGASAGTPRDLLLRTLCLDDPSRVYLDIVRWCKGEPTNRLFDTKWKNGKLGKAGPWIPWFTLR